MEAKITFCSGAGTVTGANFLLSLRESDGRVTNFLIDCGVVQGGRAAEEVNRQRFAYDPASITALFVTHAHLDHIGRIPQLVRAGFRGAIYSTAATKEIAELNLLDGLGVLEKESKNSNTQMLYEEADVVAAINLWRTVEYHQVLDLGVATLTARDAGHILGSAMYEFVVAGKKIVFTGDLGNSPSALLPDTEWLEQVDYLVMESVYGDRNHDDIEHRAERLEDVIEEAMRRGGTLVIPAFSIERTQEMLYEIEQMMEHSRIPLVPVYLDSPLAIKVTSVYKKYERYLKHSGDLFNFPQLQRTMTTDESKAIAHQTSRKIVIAGSGMSTGGRVLHHERRYLPGPNNTLLLVGYQAAGSLGRLLQEGARSVRIMGEEVAVRARVCTVSGYSAHKGSDDLVEFVRQVAPGLKRVYVVLGEPKSSFFLAQRLRDYLGVNAVVPKPGETVGLVL